MVHFFQYTSGKNLFAQDIVLWLDGKDPLGTGTPPASGTNLSNWTDKSGSGNNGIAFNTITWTSNSPNVAGTLLTGSTGSPQLYRMSNLPVTMNNQSVFFVGTCTNGSGTADFISTESASSSASAGGFLQNRITGNKLQISRWGGGIVVPVFGTTITSGTLFLYSMTYQYPVTVQPGVYAFLNGGSYSNTGTSFSQSGVGNVQIGGYTNNTVNNTGGEYWAGYISEVIMYNTTLSLGDRQKVEGYLAWKWGIQANLPVSHPYYSAAPSGFLPTQV